MQAIILNFYQVQEPVYRWLWLEGKDEPELVLPPPEVEIQLELLKIGKNMFVIADVFF